MLLTCSVVQLATALHSNLSFQADNKCKHNHHLYPKRSPNFPKSSNMNYLECLELRKSQLERPKNSDLSLYKLSLKCHLSTVKRLLKLDPLMRQRHLKESFVSFV